MSSVSIKVGKTAQAAAVATPVDPTVTLPTAVYAWSSSDTTVATVDAATGLVTAVAVGSALITAATTIDGVDGSGSAGVDVANQGNAFNVTVTITPNA